MNSTSTQFVTSRRMGAYEPIHQISMWGENYKSNGNLNASASILVEADTKLSSQSEDASHGMLGPSNKYDQEATKPTDKVAIQNYLWDGDAYRVNFGVSSYNCTERLAQNRERLRKSRLRKKAYVQQLETSRLKLIQLEQELERTRQQDMYVSGGLDASHLGFSGTMNSGVAAFEMEYKRWVEEQNRQICELRNALNAHISDVELRMLVDGGMSHYFDLFRMKATAAKADVFYMMYGMWKTSAERFSCGLVVFALQSCLRILNGLRVLVPQLDPLTEQQLFDVCNLKQSCQQAEDALSQGMEKLQQTLAETVAAGQLGEEAMPHRWALLQWRGTGRSCTIVVTTECTTWVQNFKSVFNYKENFKFKIILADHLRQETLQQMSRILTTRQAARGLLALGEYFQRLRALSSLWATRPREPA
ncbi:hypothetical protein FNV43_RR18462 [Rhamnella rubrinervis]|uniref:DOG1 domain-containing protein n=1 Tax=Rhamnella rubrinervis TaxID=2594499 RepID=A0A8K0E3R8_9ROSA|nr:hypothetical protein FNV43_RR18462 [Rhamnella rubrinervis]